MTAPTSTSSGSAGTASAGASIALPSATLSAWQAALAAEHAAIFGYGTLGPRLASTDAATARAAQRAHRALRDSTAAGIAAAGANPAPAAADYPPPYPITSAARAQQYALALESDCAAAWRYLVAAAATSPGAQVSVRSTAQAALSASAVRATYWRRALTPDTPSVAFPGI